MRNTLNFLKEYLSVILIVPTIIGGLYQLINIIYYVGFPYVRFFSVSQVIPDGILVGIFIIFFLLNYFIVTGVLRFFSINIDNLGGEKHKITYIILSIIMLCVVFWMFNTFTPDSMIGSSLGDFFWVNLIITNTCIIVMIAINLAYVGSNPNVMKVLYLFIFTFYFIFFANTLQNSVKTLNESINNDFKFYNPNALINKMIEKNPKIEISLLYANRDYLFFRINNNGSDQILVEDAKKLTSLNDDKEESKVIPCKATANSQQ